MNQADQAIDPKVIDKVRKLYAVATHPATDEHSANNASEMYQRIMREHNLSMAMIDAAGGNSNAEGGKRSKEKMKGRAAYEYQQQLMATIGHVNFVYVSLNVEYKGAHYRKTVVGYNLIGREANVIAAQDLFDYLNGTIERLGFEYVGSDNTMRLSRTAISFKEGMAERLRFRLLERHEEALRQQKREVTEREAAARHPSAASTGTALMIVMEDYAQTETDLNDDLRLDREPGTTSIRRLAGQRSTVLTQAGMSALSAYAGIDDADTLVDAARQAIDAAAATLVGIDQADLDTMIQRVLRQVVSWHITDVHEKAATAKMLAKETPKQKAAREEREERANERYWKQHDAKEQAKWNRRDHGAYRDGDDTGKHVGLDKQVGSGSKQGRLS